MEVRFFYEMVIMEYILLALFTLAAVIFIINSHYRWTYFFAIAQFVLFFSLMFSVTGQWQRGLNFAAVLFVVLMLFHRLKIHFYKQPLLVSDFFLVFDWRNWETLLHYRSAIFAIAGLIGLLVYAVMGWSSAEVISGEWRLLASAVLFFTIFSICHYNKNKSAIKQWLDSLPDDGRDVFLNLLMSCRGVFFKPPVFEGDANYFLQQKQRVPDYPLSAENEKPDIVVWLQESTLNPHSFVFERANIPPIIMYENHADTKFNSHLRVHTLGGATWKSEFAFLSGLPSTDFGTMANAVFYSVVPHLQYSFIQNLKAQGYYCVALSPFTKGNYNAKSAYDHLGFDLMLQPQELGYPVPLSKNLWTIGSDEMSQYVQKILQKEGIPALEKVQQPLFVYVLTMREHGPYHDVGNIFNLQNQGFTQKGTGELNDYIQRIVKLNEVMEEFNQYMKNRHKPYVLAYFGDHQISINGAQPAYQFDYPNPNYITQLVVRSNLQNDFKQQQDFLDLAQAGGLLLEIAGLQADEFMQANIAMRKLSGGKLQDCQDERLLAGYRNYLYQQLKVAK